MSIYDIQKGVIKIDTISNQIRKAVFELRRNGIPEPYKVELTAFQFELLREEMYRMPFVTTTNKDAYPEIHGCRIEVVESER